MKNSNLVRALDQNGTEVLVGKSFARTHGLRLVEEDQPDNQPPPPDPTPGPGDFSIPQIQED